MRFRQPIPFECPDCEDLVMPVFAEYRCPLCGIQLLR